MGQYNVKFGVIGAGKMASAILGGTFENKFIESKNIFIYDKNPNAASALALKYGFNVAKSIEELINSTDTLFLAVKPFGVQEVMEEIKKYYKNHLILTILAGVKIEKYLSFIENSNVSPKIIRIMPNTPALVNEGMSALCASENVEEKDFNFAYDLMKNCGKVIKTTEDKMDIITALSGSGPSFYYRIIDLMAKSAQKLGLNYSDAIKLSAQTALGSSKMIFENDFDIEQLIKNVTTKGGCTEVGNNILESSDIAAVLDKTIEETMKKAVELGG